VKASDLRVAVGSRKERFSAGRIVDGLQAAGADTDDALAAAREAEKRLREEGKRTVKLARLVEVVAQVARDRLGEEVAERWRQQTAPFVPIVLEHPDGDTTPFSRRVLVGSLEKVGLEFKTAWAIANQVEQGLRAEGIERIPAGEVPPRVASALEARLGREARVAYEATLARPSDLLLAAADGATEPYSRGILARSLTMIGLDPDLSHQLAKRVEEALWRDVGSVARRDDVRRTVLRLLVEAAGEEFARRYQLMRVVRKPSRPIVVLIGGSAGVGKSELAAELAYRLGIVRVVSSDSLRQALRSLISPELAPVLHASSYEAWLAELLPVERARAVPKKKRVVRGFQAQVLQLGTAIGAVAERGVTERTSLVLEGVHVVPGVSPGPIEDAMVVELMLSVEDPDVHLSRFARREGRTGARRPQAGYAEHFEEIRMLQRWLVRRAEAEGVPVLDVADLDDAVQRALEHVLAVALAESERQLDEEVAGALAERSDP